MKIITLSDIHGDIQTFDKAIPIIKASEADVVAINGDIAGSVFKDEEREIFANAQSLMYSNIQAAQNVMSDKIQGLHDVASFLASGYDSKISDSLKQTAEKYMEMEKIAEERLSWQYRVFKQRFNQLGKQVVLVPGNWDGKCLESVLTEESIHKKIKEIKGVKFTGFGGAVMTPNEMPRDILYAFDEDEAFAALVKHDDAEIVLMHSNPRFLEGDNYLFKGEYSLLAAICRNQPSLVLTGHTHSSYITKENKSGTIVVNPGNFGRYTNSAYGTFLELELDENLFVKPLTFYQVNENSVSKRNLAK